VDVAGRLVETRERGNWQLAIGKHEDFAMGNGQFAQSVWLVTDD
jgi:hypothetical protein